MNTALQTSESIGPFFIGNRLLLTGHLFSDRLNVEKNDFVPGFVVDMPSIQCLQSEWSD